jgi:hypothetical protein
MRLSLILGVCIVMCCAVAAQATLMNVVVNSTDTQLPAYQTNGHVYSNVLSYTRTPSALGTSLDEIDIYINNLAAMGPGAVPLLEGTWSCTSGMNITQTTLLGQTPWYKYIDSAYGPIMIGSFSYPDSYVNLPFNTSTGVIWSQTPGGSGGYTSGINVGQSDTSVYGSWFTGGTGLGNGSLLAKFFVHANDDISFHSTLNSDKRAIGGWSLSGVQYQGDFTTATPEPSTLFLVASGLVGLLCYAWRKRR